MQLKSGAVLVYDYLILATGSTHSYFGHEEWAKLAPGLKTVEDATEIRRRVLLAFELAERQMLEHGTHPPLKFVIVGGGPTGVELAGAISDIARLYMRNNFRHIDTRQAKVMILEGSPHILGDVSGRPAGRWRRKQLEALGVEVRTGTHGDGCSARLCDGGATERIDAVVTLWAAGVQASPLGKLLGVRDGQEGMRAGR